MIWLEEHHGVSPKALQRIRKKYKHTRDELFRERNRYGFLDLPFSSPKSILDFAKRVHGKFQDILVIGIGGSSLGAKALTQALLPMHWNLLSETTRRGYPRIFFLENVDPDEIASLSSLLHFRKTLLIAVSKSGETLETLENFFFFRKKVPRANQIIISEKKENTLSSIARKEKITFFEAPSNVAGRFSVLSVASLLPAALVGINITQILLGAKKANERGAFKLASLAFSLDVQHKKTITVVFPYSEKLSAFSDWYAQLLAESIGKKKTVGPTPMKAKGVVDQHSLLQLFMAGPLNKWYLFLAPKKFSSPLPYFQKLMAVDRMGVQQAFQKKRKPFVEILLSAITPKIIGELLQFFELEVAFLGKLYGINFWNQPAVDLSKKYTNIMLRRS